MVTNGKSNTLNSTVLKSVNIKMLEDVLSNGKLKFVQYHEYQCSGRIASISMSLWLKRIEQEPEAIFVIGDTPAKKYYVPITKSTVPKKFIVPWY